MKAPTPILIVYTPFIWGLISEEMRRELEDAHSSIFPCGTCSNDRATVFHSVFDPRRHVEADQLLKRLAESEKGETHAA